MRGEFRIDGVTYGVGEVVWLWAIRASQLILLSIVFAFWVFINVGVVSVGGWGFEGLFIVFQSLIAVALYAVGEGGRRE